MEPSLLVIPFCCGFLFFVVFFGYLILLRYFEYRESVMLAEKGLIKQTPLRQPDGVSALRWGIALTSVGIALTIGLWPLGFMFGPTYPLGIGPWMIVAFLPFFFGLGLILLYALTKEKKEKTLPGGPENPDAEK